jgi:beta-ribofuranosylaminobenzene 5'-phosphate synthase
MPRVRVAASARLHFGFCNLSLTHERLYGSLGVALEAPRTVVTAEPASDLDCEHALAAEYAATALECLEEPGAAVSVESELPRHVGLGSGTQLALATLAAVARAHGREPRVRERAPALGRGGRSGVGVAAFEAGGFVLDAGHPASRFTSERPPAGEWAVPPVTARHEVPADWRFVLALPDADPGRSDEAEDRSMRSAVEDADPGTADRIAGLVVRGVLPGLVAGDRRAFGRAVAEVGRLNGAWYAEAQGGVYRPPVGRIVERLADCPAVTGTGQSSWGPATYAVTDAEGAPAAREAAREALSAVGVGGEVLIAAPRNESASVESGSRT